MPTKVVIIDDDRFQVKHYVRALSEAGFEVELITNTSKLAPIIKGDMHQDASFFIVDMMMPPGTIYEKAETCDGEYTGLFVLRDLRRKFPVIPIILWTCAHIERNLEEAKRQAAATNICHYVRKTNLSPSLLVSELNYYLEKGRFRPQIGKFLWKAVRIGGHILGVGADIKTLGV